MCTLLTFKVRQCAQFLKSVCLIEDGLDICSGMYAFKIQGIHLVDISHLIYQNYKLYSLFKTITNIADLILKTT